MSELSKRSNRKTQFEPLRTSILGLEGLQGKPGIKIKGDMGDEGLPGLPAERHGTPGIVGLKGRRILSTKRFRFETICLAFKGLKLVVFFHKLTGQPGEKGAKGVAVVGPPGEPGRSGRDGFPGNLPFRFVGRRKQPKSRFLTGS